jgi:RNA polymerase sigma-70 factor (ECF subfamily)
VIATSKEIPTDYRIDFEDLITRYSPMLFRVALRRLRNIEDAEDAVQDALLSAYKYFGQFEGRSQVSTWLTRIVTNAALMKLRQYPRRETVSLDQTQESDLSTLADELRDEKPNPEAICAQTEMDEILRGAIDRLSPRLRSAIQLCELNGFSTQEAATALGISTAAMKSRAARGRASLNVLLGSVIGSRPAAETGPVMNHTSIVHGRHRLLEHGAPFAAAAGPVGQSAHDCNSDLVTPQSPE